MTENKKQNIIDLDDLRSFMKIFSKNWYIILFFVIISMVISYFYTYKLPDIYAAKTQILLKSDNTYDYQKQLFKGLGYTQDYQDTYNQIRVLSSNDIIEKAVNKLKLDVSYFIVGRLKTTEVYESMPFDFYVSFISNDLYEEGIKFKILDVNHFQLTYKKDNKELSNNYPFGKEVVDNNFILTVKRKFVYKFKR